MIHGGRLSESYQTCVSVCVYVHVYMFPKEHFGTYEAFMYVLFLKEMIHLADF